MNRQQRRKQARQGRVNRKDDAWSEDDREWFSDHPGRAWRLRTPFAGEIEDLLRMERAMFEEQGIATFLQPTRQERMMSVTVHQVWPGFRVRLPLPVLADSGDRAWDDYSDAEIEWILPSQHLAWIRAMVVKAKRAVPPGQRPR